ncbi:MAG: DegT/DnrJ/EryC1/StrS family aminotransferase [Muribaculaceae bacterium]|nr:DegT/DnrJ/EryC1/StrS family aminotransferase [Muribaculaceae bacterium]
MDIKMVDLHAMHMEIEDEIRSGFEDVMARSAYIGGEEVARFEQSLSDYTGVPHVVTCGSGTAALYIALKALEPTALAPGDEVIVPAFAYAACAEAVLAAGMIPVMADVDPATFNLTSSGIEAAVSPRTRGVIPVHLFGQPCDMASIMPTAQRHRLVVIEDNAQSLGAACRMANGEWRLAGSIGTVGCTSFFPTKPLGAYGDGGAMMTADSALGRRLRMIANHGQSEKYRHSLVGCNSRLDTLQAVVLSAKLPHIAKWNAARREVARYYTDALAEVDGIRVPVEASGVEHVYHQYTIQVADGRRDSLRERLASAGVATMVYYPMPLHRQEAYRHRCRVAGDPEVADRLSRSVLSLPLHTALTPASQDYVIDVIKKFFNS